MNQALVEGLSLLGDGAPAKVFDRALAASLSECVAAFWIFHQSIDLMGKVLGEGFWIEWTEGAFMTLCEWHEVTGLIMHDDFRDAADGRADDGCFASHGFEINNTERLVNGRATENGRAGVEFDDGWLVDHVVDPKNAVALLLGGFDR